MHAAEAVHLHSAGPGAATHTLDGDGVLLNRRQPAAFTALLLRRKYVLWRCALVCERLRCEPWRPWGWGETTRGPRRPAAARRGVGH